MKLIPRVYRKVDGGKAELELILNFDRQAPLRYASWPQEKSHRLLLMQHFGLPTRLLDWSMGVLTALYFAVSEERPGQSASLWALNPGKLNRRMIGNQAMGVFNQDEREIQELVDIAFQRFSERPDPGDRILAMSGPELDLRMLMQWGVFTIHATETPIENLPNYQDFATEISIPAGDRCPLRHALLMAGFCHSRLFPDLQSLAEHIKDVHKY